METLYAVLVALAAVVVIRVFIYKRRGGKGQQSQAKGLRGQCRRQLNMPPAQAEETIERYKESLRQKHPGQSEEWYLEKILYDLQRDR